MLYSTRALVLAKREIKDREFTYTLLTQGYGRVGGFARETKSKTGADIGALVEVLFDTKGSVNKIRSLEPLMSVYTDLLGYTLTHEFLLFTECLRKHFPEGS